MATDTSKRDLTGCAAGSNLLDGSKSNLMFLKCGSSVAQVWLKYNSSMAQVWLKCGSSVAQVWLTYGSHISRYRYVDMNAHILYIYTHVTICSIR